MPEITCLDQTKHIRMLQPVTTLLYACTLTHYCNVLTVGTLSVPDQILLVVNSYIVGNDRYHELFIVVTV